MKANFALSLSFDGIRLLHRAAGGWRLVGEVSLSNADLGSALSALRETAQGLEPDGLRTKLVIPDDQIRYLTIGTHDADDDTRWTAARAALKGATPYEVDDLAFDISPDGDRTHIAAIAKETLAEAEAFAVDHQFHPISAVAVPQSAEFLGEPFFGATAHAASILTGDDTVEADGIAVVILGDIAPDDGPVAVVEAANPDDEAATVASVPPEIAEDGDKTNVPILPDVAGAAIPGFAEDASDTTLPPADHLPRIDEQTVVSPRPDLVDNPVDTAGSEDVTLVPGTPPMAAATLDEIADVPPVPVGFASRRASTDSPTPSLAGVTRAEPEAPVGDTVLAASIPADPAIPPVVTARVPEELGVKPPSIGGFMSRRKAPVPPIAQDVFEDDPARSQAKTLPPHRVPKPTSERQGMTIFGARKPEVELAIGGKPRFLGLILTAVLLVFLAGMAAWASVFLDDGLSRFFSPRPDLESPIRAEELEPEPELQTSDIETASLSLDLPPPRNVPARAEPAPADVFDPQQAEEFYAVTGIWTIPPEVPSPPSMIDLDNLYITSIDRRNLSFDAVALVAPGPYGGDRAITGPSNPAPAGTEFALDSRGLVIPTVQGALSPDGVIVYLGRPPAIPPAIPDRAARLPELEEVPAGRPELAAYRPKMRPGNLVEQTERTNLGGLSRSELAQYRPKMRPASAKVEEELDETPTAQAVAASPRPNARPRNFEKLVARARQTPKRAPEAETTTQVAAVAPRTVAPSIPSRTSVATQATVKNAINLRKVNLMGVFGTPSNRRALVRLSNGRYKKVQVGDRIDGGKVSAIGESELRYQKGGRNIILKMPRT